MSQHNHNEWSIRLAADQDVELLTTIKASQTPWLDLGYGVERCRSGIKSGLAEIEVAVDDSDNPVGFIRWRPDGFIGQPYLQLLAVAPDRHGQGIGKALIGWLEQEVFVREGAANLFLCVSSFNHKAKGFYHHLGYTEVGTLQSFLRAGLDEVILRKTVRPLLEE